MSGWYAGIGSRRTPPEALALITRLACALEMMGVGLRSGGAKGADQAFAAGATRQQIFLPWNGFENQSGLVATEQPGWERALEIAEAFHPAWGTLGPAVRRLMGRNTMQLLGPHCDPSQASRFLVCWAESSHTDSTGAVVNVAGGSGQAVRIAVHFGIPVLNLALADHRQRIEAWLLACASPPKTQVA